MSHQRQLGWTSDDTLCMSRSTLSHFDTNKEGLRKDEASTRLKETRWHINHRPIRRACPQPFPLGWNTTPNIEGRAPRCVKKTLGSGRRSHGRKWSGKLPG